MLQRQFQYKEGFSTLRLRRAECGLALATTLVLPSDRSDSVGTRNQLISELNTLPTDAPLQRFKRGLTTALAWLGARVARYAFPVRLFHSRLHAGLSRRYPELPLRGGQAALIAPAASLASAGRGRPQGFHLD